MSSISKGNVQRIFQNVLGYIRSELMTKVTIVQSPNQTISVTIGGVETHTKSFYAPKNTPYTAKVLSNSGYLAGTISVEQGVLYEDVEISASQAVINSNDTQGVEIKNIDGARKFTVPADVKVIQVYVKNTTSDELYGILQNATNFKNWIEVGGTPLTGGETRVAYVGVTPGKEYAVQMYFSKSVDRADITAKISWSAEINKETPTIEDY